MQSGTDELQQKAGGRGITERSWNTAGEVNGR